MSFADLSSSETASGLDPSPSGGASARRADLGSVQLPDGFCRTAREVRPTSLEELEYP